MFSTITYTNNESKSTTYNFRLAFIIVFAIIIRIQGTVKKLPVLSLLKLNMGQLSSTIYSSFLRTLDATRPLQTTRITEKPSNNLSNKKRPYGITSKDYICMFGLVFLVVWL